MAGQCPTLPLVRRDVQLAPVGTCLRMVQTEQSRLRDGQRERTISSQVSQGWEINLHLYLT